jgi:hypothetical protein
VLTLRVSADLLSAASSTDGLGAITTLLGFDASPEPLGDAERQRLGLPTSIQEVHLALGTGALRALLVVLPPDRSLRSQLGEIAIALTRHTSHVLWLVLAAAGDEVGVACWTAGRPRVVALVANRRRIVASDAEALCALAAARDGDDLLVHTRWSELLGRDALTRRFYRTLEQRVRGLAQSLVRVPPDDASELALLTASRLLFLCFLQSKGWLNGERNFLSARYDACLAHSGRFHGRVLLPLFFGTLNTPMRRRAPTARAFGAIPFLNGGLFGRTALERRYPDARFSDAALGELFAQLLDAYRFTAREDDAEWSEVAIDPEMLGKAFESLMAQRERRVTGAFYTPQTMVAHLADEALVVALGRDGVDPEAVRTLLEGGTVAPRTASALRARLARLTVLDPACGSGAFLVHALERLTALSLAVGDPRAPAAIRREILARAIHGVDINPTAVWLCELRLWLCVVIESAETDMRSVVPLPNLDRNIRVGDALAGDGFEDAASFIGPSPTLARLRERYARAAGARKAPLRAALGREERRRAVALIDRALDRLAGERRERILARRGRDLFGERVLSSRKHEDATRAARARTAALRRERRRLQDGGALPFAFASHFAHVVGTGGFDLVLGNPPWVRLHNIPVAMRLSLRDRFTVYRDAPWRPVRDGDDGRAGFGAQIDLASLFVERALSLTCRVGTVALVVPAKLWRSLSGGAVRRYLSTRATLNRIEDWTDGPDTFDAAVYPSLLIASRSVRATDSLALTVRRRQLAVSWVAEPGTHRFDVDPASPWLLLPPAVRHAFDLLALHGVPFANAPIGRPTLGLKCGCNDAFTVSVVSQDGPRAFVEHLGRRGEVERAILRPLLRGDALTPWTVTPGTRSILWTHQGGGGPLPTLPSGAGRWLAPWKARLSARSDLHGSRAWWSLFRTEGAESARPRVVWGDFGKTPRAALLAAGDATVPLNSCYVLACDDLVDALTLTALFNSPLAAAWLNALAEPARGGWHRYLAWTVGLLPLPADWSRARELLAPLAERAILGHPPSSSALLAAACRAYRVRADEMAPLLAWSC